MNDGGVRDMFNWMIVRRTGRYKKHTWVMFMAKEISLDPTWRLLFFPVSATTDGDDDEEQQTLLNSTNTIYDLHITDVGWFDIILGYDTKEKIGKRFQNPVYDPTSKRIGTDRGYHFYFQLMRTNTRKGNRIIWQISCFIS